VIEGPVSIGADSIIHAGAKVMGQTTLGARNVVHSTAVIGDWPQDRKYHGEPSEVRIGDDNVFREGVTVHRGTGAGTVTTIGSRCFLMTHSHVGHNCTVGDDVTLINGALLGGHVQVFPRAIIGAHSVIHQFCRVGRMAMTSFCGYNVDVPPFCIGMSTNHVTQLNFVGLRRSGVPRANISALRQMFQLLFRSDRLLKNAIDDLPVELTAVPEVAEFVAFIRATKRGVARFAPWSARRGEHHDVQDDEEF
jgi:UDP-N-acetylglucosamine acyltransferase